MENNMHQDVLLEEVKKITAHIEHHLARQKKLVAWSIGVAVFMFIFSLVASIVIRNIFLENINELNATSSVPSPIGWWDVDRDVRGGNIDEAFVKAQQLIQKTPNDYSGHIKLAHIYLIREELEAAEQHFIRAYEILPTEEHANYVNAIRQRRQGRIQEKSQTSTESLYEKRNVNITP